jgi:hypothetical protein
MPQLDLVLADATAKLWFGDTPLLNGKTIAVLGALQAKDQKNMQEIIRLARNKACELQCPILVGPMDGATWQRYRAIVESDGSPAYFLESPYGAEVAEAFKAEGAKMIASYASARSVKPERRYSPDVAKRTGRTDLAVRSLNASAAEDDLRAMYKLCLKAFQNNFLYSPISEKEFLDFYLPVIPKIPVENVLLAEDGNGQLCGFIFAVPNLLAADPNNEFIIKTYASDVRGLGGWLADELQQRAQLRGVTSFIHALMHEDNVSLKNSAHYAKPFRKYELFSLETGA